ncbi:hypothetical protein ABT354_18135 [Streptomyces sp. NPDC000594]|uniref:hypothetical protein n=1 Tax=Streptomyces sp. NPDC000594 TaxID=3154261 RepID=UPI0033189FE1
MRRTRSGTGWRSTAAGAVGTVGVLLVALLTVGTEPARGTGQDPASPGPTARTAPDRTAGAAAALRPEPPGAVPELARLQKRIAARVVAHGTAYTFASYLDRTTGRIVLESDAPPKVVTEVAGRRATAPLRAPATGPVRDPGLDLYHRRDDTPPFYGGGGIRTAGTGPCTSGFAVRNGAGTVLMTGSASCFPAGAAVVTESGAQAYGTVAVRQPAVDAVLIGGGSYAGRIFTGPVTSTTSIPVVSAGEPVVGGAGYCHSGRTTGEQCGHTVISTNGQLCGPSGCMAPVVVFNDGVLPQPGDQGAPFYAKNASGAHARGQVILASGTTGYVTSWGRLSGVLGLTIVTG